MEEFFNVFCEENWLQVLDHFITILLGIASFILALIVYSLTKKDKQKTIAINELKSQTKQLENLYLNLICPRFICVDSTKVSPHKNKIINVGGDCFKLFITLQHPSGSHNQNPFKNWASYFASHSEREITIDDIILKNSYLFKFQDMLGNKYKQIITVDNSNNELFNFTPVETDP